MSDVSDGHRGESAEQGHSVWPMSERRSVDPEHMATEESTDEGKSWICACDSWSGTFATSDEGLAAHWQHVLAASSGSTSTVVIGRSGEEHPT